VYPNYNSPNHDKNHLNPQSWRSRLLFGSNLWGAKMLRREDIPLAVMSMVSLAILLVFAVSVFAAPRQLLKPAG
jgi:hypothetical protein